MSQDQDKSQDMSQGSAAAAAPGGSTSTGATCTSTGLYRATDGRIEFVRLIKAGEKYPPFPGGTGTTSTSWTKSTTASDGNRTGFTAVKVAAGTA